MGPFGTMLMESTLIVHCHGQQVFGIDVSDVEQSFYSQLAATSSDVFRDASILLWRTRPLLVPPDERMDASSGSRPCHGWANTVLQLGCPGSC